MVHHKIPRTKLRGIFLLYVFEGTAVSVHQRGREQLAPAACVPVGKKMPSGAFLERGRVPDGAPEKAATFVAAFLLHHSLRDGLTLCASARVRLAGTGR